MTLITGCLHDLPSTVASKEAHLTSRHLAVCWDEKLKPCFQRGNLLFVRMEFQDMLSLLIILSDVLCHKRTNQSDSSVYILNGIYLCNLTVP